MDKKTKKEIYDKWKSLESDCHIEVYDMHDGKYHEPKSLEFEKMIELNKYRKWVLNYCPDLLDLGQKWELQRFEENQLKCTCTDRDCAKCLLVNCQDDDCYFHSKQQKDDFKKNYNNRK